MKYERKMFENALVFVPCGSGFSAVSH